MTSNNFLKNLRRFVAGGVAATMLYACADTAENTPDAILAALTPGDAGEAITLSEVRPEIIRPAEARNEDGSLKYQNYFVRLAENVAPPTRENDRWIFPGESDEAGDLKNLSELTELFRQHGVHAFEPAFPGIDDPILKRTYGMEVEFEAEALAAALREEHRERFALIEAVPQMWPLYTPNDYFSPIMAAPDSNWHLNITKATGAWSISRGDPDVVIGIMEARGTYFDENHEDLQGEFRSIYYSWGHMGGVYHGGAVAHLASGKTDNGIGLASMGYNTKLAGFVWTSFGGWSDIGQIYVLVKRGARIINMSFYFGDHTGRPVHSGTAHTVIKHLYSLDAILIAGAGNDLYPNDLHYPASWPEVLSVTSIGADGSHYNSNGGFTHAHNAAVDLSAPGYSVPVVQANNTYANWGTGSSLAAPIVSGAAALMLSANPCLSADDVLNTLKSTAQSTVNLLPSNAPYSGKLGSGLLDAHAAVSAAANLTSTTFAPPNLRAGFTYEIQCDANLNSRLLVTGANNRGLTHQQYNLYDQATNQLVETQGFPATSANVYDPGPHRFGQILDPQKRYYVKHGVWDACQPWQEVRVYDIRVTTACIDQQNYALTATYRTHLQAPHNINGFEVSGDNSGAVDRIEFSIRVTATSTPIQFVRHSPALPATIPWNAAGAAPPHGVEAVIFFTNGQTKVLSWM
ncbi:MAG: S8 family serine peptidase [bacterium]|nr:S8 family serine peptidase [bacterium]